MSAPIGFRPTVEDERILRDAAQPGESTSGTLRRNRSQRFPHKQACMNEYLGILIFKLRPLTA